MNPPSTGVVPLHTDASGAAPPDAFGPFRVLHQVGAGALGPVFRGFDPDRDRLVAIKLFRLGLPPERMHKFVAELERLCESDLTHPAIVRPIAVGTDGVVAYAAQEFVSAESLDVVIRDRGAAPAAEALRLAAELAGALDFAAVVDVHHGSLHPRDVLLTDYDVRLTGLGIARALEQIGVTPPVRRPYSPPERVAGRAWDRRADVFALATLIFEMISGRRVSGTGAEAARSLSSVAGADLVALRATFARALAEQPADRFDTALEFAVALKAALPDAVIAPTESLPVPLPPLDVPARMPLLRDVDAADAPGLTAEPVAAAEEPFASNRAGIDETIVSPAPPAFDDFDLRAAERDRYEDAELAPAAAPEAEAETEISSRPSLSAALDEPHPVRESSPLFVTQAETPRPSRRWPLALAALLAGLAIGFGGGYLAGGNRASTEPISATASLTGTPASRIPETSKVVPPAKGRDFTEGSVTQNPAKGTASKQEAAKQESARIAGAGPETPAASTGAAPSPAPTRPPAARPAPAAPVAGKSAAAETALTGRLLVRSSPSDATVFIDDRERGRTPATIRDLSRGTHRVRVERDGYVTETRRIAITPSRPSESLIISLDRETPPAARSTAARPPAARAQAADGFVGDLAVDSRPPGAQVFLDGKAVGTTPLGMVQVAAGTHVIRLERDGYRRWTSSIRVVTGERNRVTASLER